MSWEDADWRQSMHEAEVQFGMAAAVCSSAKLAAGRPLCQYISHGAVCCVVFTCLSSRNPTTNSLGH